MSGPMTNSKAESENWILLYAETIGFTYQDLMDGTEEFLTKGEYLIRGGDLDGVALPKEFWDHYETATGTKVPPNKREHFFSCVC